MTILWIGVLYYTSAGHKNARGLLEGNLMKRVLN